MAPHSFKFVYNPETHAIVLFNQRAFGGLAPLICYDFMRKNLLGLSPFWHFNHRVDDLPLLAAIEMAGSLAACQGRDCSLECALVPRPVIHHIRSTSYQKLSIDFTGWLLESMDTKVREHPGNDCRCWETLSGSRDKMSKVLPSVEVVVYHGDSQMQYVIFHDFWGSDAPDVNKQTVVDLMCESGHIPEDETWSITYKLYKGHPWRFELRQADVCTDSDDELHSLEIYDDYLDIETTVLTKTRKAGKARKARKARKPLYTASRL